MDDSLEQRIRRVLSTLKCSLCKNILSVPPINAISNNGKQLRCGRCVEVSQPSSDRNFAFEEIAKEFTFPCIYEGCDALVPWNEVQKHEKICNEKSIICPFDYHKKCKLVKVKELLEHLRKQHESDLFSDSLTRELDEDEISCLTFNNHIFHIHTGGYLDSILVTKLYNSSNTDMSFTYNLRFYSNSNNKSVLFEKQPIKEYDERKHCYSCWKQSCLLPHHPYSQYYRSRSNLTTIKEGDLFYVEKLLGNNYSNKIEYSIEIVAVKNNLSKAESSRILLSR